jgi:hypothetical protein
MLAHVGRWAPWLSGVALALLLAAFLDPLELFPLLLFGGALAAIVAWAARSRWLRLEVGGVALAGAGAIAMLVLTALGGVGGAGGLPQAWLLLVLPYPAGGLLLLVATALLVAEQLRRSRQAR